jgi:ribonuclease HIII
MLNPVFVNQINQMQTILAKQGIVIREDKEISYGVKLEFTAGVFTAVFDLLYSEKKQRFSLTYKKGFAALSNQIGTELSTQFPLMTITLPKEIASSVSPKSDQDHTWNCWIGSDESGKGDFFGPLVTASFCCTVDEAKVLQTLGIADSKTLNDSKITELAKMLYKAYPKNINCFVLRPEKYNEVYQNMVRQGKKLNELMDWMHFKTIEKLLADSTPDGILIDKYSASGKLQSKLKTVFSREIVLRTKAESDPAVAAASIIARYQFITAMELMNRSYKMVFPKGASKQVITAAKAFVIKYGKEDLHKVAKIHFKTMDSL